MKLQDPRSLSREELIKYADELAFTLMEKYEKVTPSHALADKFKLTKQQADILYALRDGSTKSFGQLRATCVFSSRNGFADVEAVSRVQVCRMKQKLAEYGIAIENVYGIGYRLVEGSDIVRQVLKDAGV